MDLTKTVSRLGEDLAKRARPLGEDLVRRVGERLPAARAAEPRSFLDSPAGQAAGAAALGLMAGLAFGIVRKGAMQGAEALAGDWLAVLKAEHRMVEKLFEQMLATSEHQTMKRGLLLGKIAHALSKHALQEEMAVYPALKAAGDDSQAMHLYEDHAEIKIFISELQQMAKNDPRWIIRAREFQLVVGEHVRQEENEIFPLYHARQSPNENRRLTLRLHREGLRLA